MRTFISIVVLILILGVGYFGYAHFTGGSVPTFGLPLGGERVKVRARIGDFFEHVKFKNSSALKNFVSPETSEEELSLYLVKSLGLNAENSDLETVIVDKVEINQAENRARAHVSLAGKNLSDKTPLLLFKIIFMFKNSDDVWLIDTKSASL